MRTIWRVPAPHQPFAFQQSRQDWMTSPTTLKSRAQFDLGDPNCPQDWRELYQLQRQFELSRDSDERFELGKRITELSKRVWEFL